MDQDLIDYYQTDRQDIYTQTVQIDPMAPLPGAGTLTAPPETTGTEVAQWRGDAWLILPERPPLPEPPPPSVPQSCTPAQGLVALYAVKGITEDDVHAAITQIPDPVQRYTAQIGFTRATLWERQSATMQAMALLLSLSEADLDAMFTFAAGVQV